MCVNYINTRDGGDPIEFPENPSGPGDSNSLGHVSSGQGGCEANEKESPTGMKGVYQIEKSLAVFLLSIFRYIRKRYYVVRSVCLPNRHKVCVSCRPKSVQCSASPLIGCWERGKSWAKRAAVEMCFYICHFWPLPQFAFFFTGMALSLVVMLNRTTCSFRLIFYTETGSGFQGPPRLRSFTSLAIWEPLTGDTTH